jgi:hypothetical protein
MLYSAYIWYLTQVGLVRNVPGQVIISVRVLPIGVQFPLLLAALSCETKGQG